MKLKSFSVTNYKIFKDTFDIGFSDGAIIILTGRNNTGKSTILEAINLFYKKEGKAKTIPSECFSNRKDEIILKAIFKVENDDITIVKRYKDEFAPKFYDESGVEIKNTHPLKDTLDEIQNNSPFYITPSMLPDDINHLIQEIYSEVIKNDLKKLEDIDGDSEENAKLVELANEYLQLKNSYPEFLNKLKLKTDKQLEFVSEGVSNNLRDLFSNEDLSLNIKGGESEGFSSNDILKTTNSSINIDSRNKNGMPLSNQGTGLQRMSLIYLIQNLIQNKLMGENKNKLLLIDEPEAFLHPEAVRALSRSLYNIGEEMPLMISTHSPVLIDLSENHTTIQLFRIGDIKAIELFKTESNQFDDDDLENMKILNYTDSHVNEFFFANRILIVEGDTEYIAFKHFAKIYNDNIHIVRARGKSTIVTMMKILNQFNASYDVLHDVDNHARYKLTTLKAQLTNCKKIYKQKKSTGVRVLSSISNFELAIGLDDVKDDNKTKTIYRIINEESTESEYGKAKAKIEVLYNYIAKWDKTLSLGEGFIEVKNEEDYEVLFNDLISEKEKEKVLSKENELSSAK